MGEMIYAPYDLTGVKFLWWTWHDTDAPVRERILGVPLGSTVWVITFTASFQVIFSNYKTLIVIEGRDIHVLSLVMPRRVHKD